jgi:hypothetical protein
MHEASVSNAENRLTRYLDADDARDLLATVSPNFSEKAHARLQQDVGLVCDALSS